MAKLKAAVIFGGTSREHKLSLATAADVIRNIPEDKYEVICIGITKKGHWLYFPGSPDEIESGEWEMNPDCTSAIISPDPLHRGIITIENGETSIKRIDVVFPLLMGRRSADGDIQGLLDLSGIPFVGCGLLAAASCTDKSHTHMVLDALGIKTADWSFIPPRDINIIDQRCTELAEKLGYPLKVRPANSGSSVGTTLAHNYDELVSSVKIAFSNDKKVVVEKFVKARKLEAAVMGFDEPVSSYVGEILNIDKDYDPLEVNTSTGDNLRIPADISDEMMQLVRETAVTAYKALGCRGYARVDFFLTENGELLVNKIGTAPGLRCNSVFPKLMEHYGISMPDLMDKLLEQAIENADRYY